MVTLRLHNTTLIVSLKEFLYIFEWNLKDLQLIKRIDVSLFCKNENTHENGKDLNIVKKNEVLFF